MSQFSIQWCRPICVRAIVAAALLQFAALAQAQSPPPYGEAISIAQAKKIVAAAEAEAVKNNWSVAIAIVDGSGFLVAFERLDNTQLASLEIAMAKAKTAAHYRRPTKVFEDRLATGGSKELNVLKLPGVLPIEGGLPIIQDGKIIGAIGVSGAKSTEDAQVAAAGIEAISSKTRP
jgi:glc operon protein GlcG